MTKASVEILAGDGEDFAALTFPRYRIFLGGTNSERLAVGARVDGVPVGLALAGWRPDAPSARLFSLMVAPEHRRRSIGRRLLASCDDLAAAKRRERVVAYYSSRLPGAAAFAATLGAAGWTAPRAIELRGGGLCGPIAEAIAGWPGVSTRLLKDGRFAITPWAERSCRDIAAIERLSSLPGTPPGLTPGLWAGQFDEAPSLLLREEGEVVGWVLARLDPPDPAIPHATTTLAVQAAFIRRELWRSGMLVAGYHATVQQHAQRFGPEAPMRFSTRSDYPGMVALVRRRFTEVALWMDEWMEASKLLSPRATTEE